MEKCLTNYKSSSTMQAKFMACYKDTIQAVWLKNFVLGLPIIDSIITRKNLLR